MFSSIKSAIGGMVFAFVLVAAGFKVSGYVLVIYAKQEKTGSSSCSSVAFDSIPKVLIEQLTGVTTAMTADQITLTAMALNKA
jgi:hypothetical protein